jgi:hypothetical protein
MKRALIGYNLIIDHLSATVMKSAAECFTMSKKPVKKGAPKRAVVHFLPGVWWATELRQKTKSGFGELDRELTDQEKRKRAVKRQRYRMRAIAEGRLELQFARPNHLDMRQRAEAMKPGIEASFQSVTWDELLRASGFPPRQPFRMDLISSELLADLKAHEGIHAIGDDGVVLTEMGVARCAVTLHLDALGLLLMQKRLHLIPVFKMGDVFFIRLWLGMARQILPFRVNRKLMLDEIARVFPEFGLLQGKDGVRRVFNEEQLLRAKTRFFLKFAGHNQYIWASPYPKRPAFGQGTRGSAPREVLVDFSGCEQ